MSSQRPVDGRRPATHMRAEGGRKMSINLLLRLLAPVCAGSVLWISASSAKILPSDHWIEGGGGGGRGGGSGYHRETFYVWLYPAEAARPVIAQLPFYGGGALAAALPPR